MTLAKTYRIDVRDNVVGPYVSNCKPNMIAEHIRERAKKGKYVIGLPFRPHYHSSFSLELFASLYAVAKAAVSRLYFLSFS